MNNILKANLQKRRKYFTATISHMFVGTIELVVALALTVSMKGNLISANSQHLLTINSSMAITVTNNL